MSSALKKARPFHVKGTATAQSISEFFVRASRLNKDESQIYKILAKASLDISAPITRAAMRARGRDDQPDQKRFAVFKHSWRGVYQHCREKHLHRYPFEFEFRYGNRAAWDDLDTGCAEGAVL